MVSDPDAGVRQQVATALGEFDGPEAASALVILLVDPERIVASAAADSMAEFKDPASADAILPLVTHPHAFVRMGALRALKELRRKDTLKPALEALRDQDAAVRVQAIGVIGFPKLEESIPALIQDADAHVRRVGVCRRGTERSSRNERITVTYSCAEDDGRPIGIGFQEQVPNQSELLR